MPSEDVEHVPQPVNETLDLVSHVLATASRTQSSSSAGTALGFSQHTGIINLSQRELSRTKPLFSIDEACAELAKNNVIKNVMTTRRFTECLHNGGFLMGGAPMCFGTTRILCYLGLQNPPNYEIYVILFLKNELFVTLRILVCDVLQYSNVCLMNGFSHMLLGGLGFFSL